MGAGKWLQGGKYERWAQPARRLLFFHLLAGFFPTVESRCEIVKFFEAHRFHFLAGSGATHADGAIHEISFVRIKGRNFFDKAARINVDIDCPRDAAFLEFSLAAHVEEHVVGIGAELVEFLDTDTLHFCSRHLCAYTRMGEEDCREKNQRNSSVHINGGND